MYPEPKSVDPVATCFSCDCTPHIACHKCKVLHCALHASTLCQSEIGVGLRQFWTANLAAIALSFDVVAVAVVDTCPSVPTIVDASVVNTRRGVWICRKWYVVGGGWGKKNRRITIFFNHIRNRITIFLGFGPKENIPPL